MYPGKFAASGKFAAFILIFIVTVNMKIEKV